MQVRYYARRELNTVDSPIHVIGTQYTFDIVLSQYDRGKKRVGFREESITGDYRMTLHRVEDTYLCKTTPVTGADLANMREFIASVINGEPFQFDDGDGFIEVTIDSDSYTESRDVKRGGGGTGDYFSFSWTHRAI